MEIGRGGKDVKNLSENMQYLEDRILAQLENRFTAYKTSFADIHNDIERFKRLQTEQMSDMNTHVLETTTSDRSSLWKELKANFEGSLHNITQQLK